MKILVIGPSWVGDTVMAQPLFERLRQRHDGVTIDVMGPAWTLPLLRRMPQVNRALALPFKHGEFALTRRWRLGRELRHHAYHQAIVLPNSWKSALIPWAAAITRRTGFVGEARWGLLNDARTLDKAALPLMVERFCALAEDRPQPLHRPIPALHLTADSANQTALLQSLALDSAGPVACLCPGAEYGPAKRWPAQSFATLARTLQGRGYAVWILGSTKDQAIGDEIAQLSGGAAHNLCGRTGLDDAIDLMALAQVVISNDSGLMHVAAALHRPLVALYGSSSPGFTPPLSPRAQVVQEAIACSPCFKRECPLGHFDCMRKLTPETVAALVP
ncbi:MAG: lipopolysaccharide heptosyltransferase II [Betaproteobacteria bacterium]|nr:lipopolysaccharide heptosyltransferase II [Betaproteobacteria bacterium]